MVPNSLVRKQMISMVGDSDKCIFIHFTGPTILKIISIVNKKIGGGNALVPHDIFWMSLSFPLHQSSNASVLEPHRDIVVEMRRNNWPYRKIALWLMAEKNITISHEAVRKFCLVRNIRKGKDPVPVARENRTLPVSQPQKRLRKNRQFNYDDSKPIQVKRK